MKDFSVDIKTTLSTNEQILCNARCYIRCIKGSSTLNGPSTSEPVLFRLPSASNESTTISVLVARGKLGLFTIIIGAAIILAKRIIPYTK
ncbi:unnamed protein product [Leptidea sinapis]|uniref:Uncharacterized protein n=1 Tax=Leptidea sinapis TaxID=189913 RepID=A0A5E4Q3T5_9NEOP|nr:unnamed protein product [Leptidea sinapis]